MRVEPDRVVGSSSLVDRAEAVERLRVPSAPGEKLRVRRLRWLVAGVLMFGASMAVYLWLLMG